jgi:hypothetical protein
VSRGHRTGRLRKPARTYRFGRFAREHVQGMREITGSVTFAHPFCWSKSEQRSRATPQQGHRKGEEAVAERNRTWPGEEDGSRHEVCAKPFP